MDLKAIKKLAEKEAGDVKNWLTPDDRQHFIDGFIKGFNRNKEVLDDLWKLHNHVIAGTPLEVDYENKVITQKDKGHDFL